MSKSGLHKADEELWIHAEGIFQRYKKREFDIDEEKGKTMMLATRTWVEPGRFGGMKDKKEEKQLVLADVWANHITQWETNRGNPYYWRDAAEILVNTYAKLRSYNAEIPGRDFARQLADKDQRIKVLEEKNTVLESEGKQAMTKAAEWEKRYRELFDHCNEVEVELHTYKIKEEAERQADIRDSWNQAKSSLQSSVEPEKKDEDQNDEEGDA